MERMAIRLFVSLALTLGTLLGLEAGVAQVDITPPMGAPLAGYYYNRAATGIHDALHAKAIVLAEQGTRLVLITCDLSAMPDGIAARAREIITRQTGIPASHVMISATHTHTAPVVLSGFSRYQLEGEMLRIAQEYAARLPESIARAAVEANGALQPARLFAAMGTEGTLAFNRRFHMKNGPVAWNPGKTTTEIVRPAGPTDPALPILYLESPKGEALAVYVNYAMHLDTVGGTEFSADFVSALERSLRAAKGAKMLALFTMGCAGNINHLDTSWKAPQKGHEEAARIGTVLAAAVLQALKQVEAIERPVLRGESVVVPLPTVERGVKYAGHQSDFLKQVTEAREAELASFEKPVRNAEAQYFQLSEEHGIAGLPGEIFVELGLRLKATAAARWMAIATQTNGNVGYVPDRKAYAQGNYEVVSARVAAGAGETLVDALLGMVGKP
jgi:neutral ceramidase